MLDESIIIESVLKAARHDDPHKLTFDRFPYARLMTVEVEAEPVGDNSGDVEDLRNIFETREWEMHRDPSLSRRGVEFVSPTTAGDSLDDEVRFAVDTLKGAGYDATMWASVHVHVDVRDMSQQDVGMIILLSGLNQDHIYQVCPRHRYNSPFCQPFPQAFLDALEERLRGEDGGISDVWERHLGATMGNEFAAFHRSSRWYGVNYRPFREQGSLEWRMFNEPLDAGAIMSWCELVHQIVDRGASSDIDDIVSVRTWPEFFEFLALHPRTHGMMKDRRRRYWLSGRKPVDYAGLPTVQPGGRDAPAP